MKHLFEKKWEGKKVRVVLNWPDDPSESFVTFRLEDKQELTETQARAICEALNHYYSYHVKE